MPVIWRHYGFDEPCIMCQAVIGKVFDEDYLGYLGPPLHPRDHCALEPFYSDADPPEEPQTSTLDWDTISGALRKAWVRLTAWILRSNEQLTGWIPLPPILEPLREEAEEYNKEREERLAQGQEVEEEEYMPDMQRVLLSAALLVDQVQGDDQIPMRFIRAGRSTPLRGFPKGVLFSEGALREAVESGMFDGAAVFFTHVDGGRDVRDLAGVTAGAVFDEDTQSVVGVVHLYGNQSGRELQALASDFRRHREQGIPHPDVGISIDSFFVFERADGGIPRAVRMSRLNSVDVVFQPAADGRILAAAQRGPLVPGKPRGGTSMLSVERVEELLEEHGVTGEVHRVLMSAQYASEEALIEAIQAARQAGSEDDPDPDSAPEREPGQRSDARQPQRVGASRSAPTAGTNPWMDVVRQEAVNVRLASSGLPQVVRQRLAAGNYDSPEELDAAVQAAREELAALAEAEVIQVGGRPPGSQWGSQSGTIAPRVGGSQSGTGDVQPSVAGRLAPRVGGMRNGVDRVTAAWDWIFGVRDTELPDPQLRDVRALYHMMTGDYEFRGVYHADRVQLTGATTDTLANIAANAMNKVIMAQFSVLTHWRWYERVAFATANDGSVHDMQWTTIGGIGNLPEVPEKGAYDELDVDDVAETDSFVKYGGYVPVTIELIRNSNIQRLQAIPRALALAAVRTRSAKVSAIFTVNGGVGPTLAQDSTALFHTDHSNVNTTAFGTDATAWRAARAECFGHTEVNSGKKLAIFPRYWLGPEALYDQALETFGYGDGMPDTYVPEAQSRGFADPRPIPLVVPDFTDTTDWAYIVDPLVFPVIHISYAQAPGGGSHPAPELFTVTSPSAGLVFTNDVLPIKVRDWFAVGVNGPRGIGKRNVAGG